MEYAKRALRLSLVMATSEPMRIVAQDCVGQIRAQARVGEQVDAEDIDDHLEDGEDTGLDHGDCV